MFKPTETFGELNCHFTFQIAKNKKGSDLTARSAGWSAPLLLASSNITGFRGEAHMMKHRLPGFRLAARLLAEINFLNELTPSYTKQVLDNKHY